MSFLDLMGVLKSMSSNYDNNNKSVNVHIDFNWLRISKTNPLDLMRHRISSIKNFIGEFSKCKYTFMPACDPNNQHCAKRASDRRKAKTFANDVNIRSARCDMQKACQQFTNADLSLEGKIFLEEKQTNLRKSTSKNVLSSKLLSEVSKLLEHLTLYGNISSPIETGGLVELLKTGACQADLLIAKMYSSNI